ncbi:MAG: NUMOD1 domain-containing DNA-binding protein [Puia sp.]|nr:NUMOD1 domain-containing DNA-binding protein [Puia sp.]
MPVDKKYPCQNLSLSNLPGETWKEIALFEDLYQVSSHGRIKSLPRLCEIAHLRTRTTVSYWTKEKIRKIKVHRQWNSIVSQEYFDCTISLSLGGGKTKTLMVHRLVYQAFVGDIDFETDHLMIMHKDGDGLNNHYHNLVAGKRTDVLKKSYQRKRHISCFSLKTKKEFKKISQKSALSRQKKVIQYSLEGNRLHIFNSLKEAALQIGIPGPNLVRALKGGALTAGGYVWRYFPDRKKIQTVYIRKRKDASAARFRKAIQQYSLKGKLLKNFGSIAEAAEKTGISRRHISKCLAGKMKTTGAYTWKTAPPVNPSPPSAH